MKNKTFGIFNDTVTVKYCIIILWNDNTYSFVTEVSTYPKTFKFAPEKQAKFWESREYAEDLATAMNVNGYNTFVMEVPSVFHYENFVNPKREEKKNDEEED